MVVGALLLVGILIWEPWRQDEESGGPDVDTHQAAVLAELAQRDRLDQSVWADERLSQQYGARVVQLWDQLRTSADPWSVLGAFPLTSVRFGAAGKPESLQTGIQRVQFGPASRRVTPAELQQKLNDFADRGYRLVSSSWQQIRFDPRALRGPESQYAFVLHVVRDATDTRPERRYVVQGELRVPWTRSDNDSAGQIQAREVEVSRAELLARQGDVGFRPLLECSRRTDDLNSAHPVIVYDLDGDGLAEIVLSRWNRVYWNVGDGRFREDQFLEQFQPHRETGIVADFNGDGAADFLTVDERGYCLMFLGERSGRFKNPARRCADVTFEAPAAVTAGDVDADGDLDVWLSQYPPPLIDGSVPESLDDANDGPPSALLINNGRGQFVDGTKTAGLSAKQNRRTSSASFVDLDGDVDLDLVVVSDYAGIDIYRNDGTGTFLDVTEQWMDQPHLLGRAHTMGDYDRDGKLDLYASGVFSPAAQRLDSLQLGRDDRPDVHRLRTAMTAGNRMYVAGDQRFVSPRFADRVAPMGWSWGAASCDFDLDGDVDIYLANGYRSGRSCLDYDTRFWCHDIYAGGVPPDVLRDVLAQSLHELRHGDISWGGHQHNALLCNLDENDFADIGFLMGVSLTDDTRSVIYNDLDGDGRPDLVVSRYQWVEGEPVMELHAYQNILPRQHHWIGVRLVEAADGPSPVGATVTVQTGSGRQMVHLVTGDSYLSQHATSAHFGLGDVEQVEEIRVRWVGGDERRVSFPAVDQYHLVRPPSR